MSDVYSVIGVVLTTSSAFLYSDDDAVVAARATRAIARDAPTCGVARPMARNDRDGSTPHTRARSTHGAHDARMTRATTRATPRVASATRATTRRGATARRATDRPRRVAERSTRVAPRALESARASDAPTYRLIMLRHSASSGADGETKDADRPLTREGRALAKSVATRVDDAGWTPDLTLCSNSRRSKETLEIMRDEVNEAFGTKGRVMYLGSLYHYASLDGVMRQHLSECVVKQTTAGDGADGEEGDVVECEIVTDARTIMAVGHNKGMEEAASEYCGRDVRLQVATAALLERARGEGDTWASAMADAGSWTLVAVATPEGIIQI